MGITKNVKKAFHELSKRSAGLLDISDRDILEQMFSLPYPGSVAEYFKRAIVEMEPFCNMNQINIWESDKVYRMLAELQQNEGTNVSIERLETRWKNYLSAKMKQPRKKQLLEYCIFLRLSDVESYKVLAQYNSAGFNYRNPEELLALYFITQNDERYNLKHYYNMLKEYDRRKKNCETGQDGSNMGRSYTRRAKLIIDELQGGVFGEHDEEILEFMVSNCDELTDSSAKTANNQYSRTQAENLIQLLRYIFVLMGFSATDDMSEVFEYDEFDVDNEYDEESDKKYYVINYEKRKWYADLIAIISGDAINVRKRRTGKDKAMTRKIYDYLADVKSHVYSVENRVKDKDNVEPVTRDDVLFFTLILFIGFFIAGCDEGRVTPKDLPKKSKEGESEEKVELKIDALIAKLYEDKVFRDWIDNHENIDIYERYKLARKYLSMFLEEFGFLEIYEPNVMDRLVLICLMSEDPWETFRFIYNPDHKRDLYD